MPWYLYGQPYDYEGCPELARLVEAVAKERKVQSRAVYDAELSRHYATINIVSKLARGERIVSVSSCQNCRPEHYLESGAVVAEAIRRSDLRVVMLASGALSHRFNQIDWVPNHPRIFHESNVSSPRCIEADKKAIALFQEGRHERILDL